jgi:predicted RNA-binding Zn-ribbon protein involved in translation (DUF1610 family)
MATRAEQFVSRLRQPAYTGENRCLPCTAVNALIAGALAVAVALLVTPVAGGAVLAVSLAMISLRGYLVPGTPELTKRYLPDRIRGLFGKAPELPDPGETIDVEEYLLDAGVLEDDGELVRSPSFGAAWDAHIDDARADPAADAGDLLDLTEPGIEERGEACVVTDGGIAVADWPSRAALLADLGAVPVLHDRDPGWPARSRSEQGRILAGLRLFLDSCPTCGGEPVLGEGTVESCCRQAQVYTYSCPDCGARLLEIEQ